MTLRRRLVMGSLFAVVVLAIGAEALEHSHPRIAGAMGVLYGAAIVFGIASWVFIHFKMMSVVEGVLREGANLCPRCGSSLEGLPETGACPECHAAYEMQAVHQWWRGYRGFLKEQIDGKAPPVVSWWDTRIGWWKFPEWEYRPAGEGRSDAERTTPER